MTMIVAVSGGVDSVVLLHMLAIGVSDSIVVAHFDHGIRRESAADARFVEALARRYGMQYVSRREELGPGASEELARTRRYHFLREVAEEYDAYIVTAHHLDDLVETVVLNMRRGTRWRGLATMNDSRIKRPLLKRTKSELIAYALEKRLEWVEDETNHRDVYQRNRVRAMTAPLTLEIKRRIYHLWSMQHTRRREIGEEMRKSHFPIHQRYFIIMIEAKVARELLYEQVLSERGVSLLGRQLEYMLHGIKVGHPGAVLQIGQGIAIRLRKHSWAFVDMPRDDKLE